MAFTVRTRTRRRVWLAIILAAAVIAAIALTYRPGEPDPCETYSLSGGTQPDFTHPCK
jgi:hypothetical protein